MKAYGITVPYESTGWLDAPDPVCGALDVVCTPVAMAVCTSDPHQIHAGFPAGLVLGHEVVGKVIEVGSEVKNFNKGDIIATCAPTPDWMQPECQEGLQQHCGGTLAAINWAASENGTLAEKYRVRCADMNAIIKPDNVTYAQCILAADMMTTGFYGAELADIQFGDIVVCCGIGAVGQMTIAAAKLRGASQIIGIGHRKITMELAEKSGATALVDYKSGTPIDEEVLKITGGIAPDKIIFSGGDKEMFALCVKMLKPGGTLANLMGHTFDVEIPHSYTYGFCTSKTIKGGLCPGGSRRLERMLSLIQWGHIDPSYEITHTFHGFDSIPEAYECMDKKVDAKGNEVLKTIIYCDGYSD